jgi:hypothetical protein
VEISQTISKSDATQLLHRCGYDPDLIDELISQVPDPIDFDRDGSILMRYGITRDELIGRVGGSP